MKIGEFFYIQKIDISNSAFLPLTKYLNPIYILWFAGGFSVLVGVILSLSKNFKNADEKTEEESDDGSSNESDEDVE